MEKSKALRQDQKKARTMKLHKETLRQLESFELQGVAGGIVTNGGTSCNGHPCYTL